VCIRPSCGLKDVIIEELISYLHKFDFATVGIEKDGIERHCHIIVYHRSDHQTLRRMFKNWISRMGDKHGEESVAGNNHMLKVSTITKNHCFTIGYSQKDGDVRLIRGFTSSYLNLCKAHWKKENEKQKPMKNKKMIDASNAWNIVKEFAKEKGYRLECGADLPEVLANMNKVGFVFVNRKKVCDYLRQQLVQLGDGHDFQREVEEWSFQLGLKNSL